jgi:hypothetical protein
LRTVAPEGIDAFVVAILITINVDARAYRAVVNVIARWY